MWLSVLRQASEDATAERPAFSCAGGDAERIREEASAWFRDGAPDFEEVCHLVGLDPEAVREAVLSRMERSKLALLFREPSWTCRTDNHAI